MNGNEKGKQKRDNILGASWEGTFAFFLDGITALMDSRFSSSMGAVKVLLDTMKRTAMSVIEKPSLLAYENSNSI
jgi:hypothetical protein